MSEPTQEIVIAIAEPQPAKCDLGTFFKAIEVVVMPQSALAFVITSLLALAEIKSQYQSHPLPIVFSVGCILIFGVANAAEVVVACAGLAPTSVYAIIAHLGKVGSLCILVASLASLFFI